MDLGITLQYFPDSGSQSLYTPPVLELSVRLHLQPQQQLPPSPAPGTWLRMTATVQACKAAAHPDLWPAGSRYSRGSSGSSSLAGTLWDDWQGLATDECRDTGGGWVGDCTAHHGSCTAHHASCTAYHAWQLSTSHQPHPSISTTYPP